MKLPRLALARNWRNAVGEVALIVIGVTIALAATSWYEDRQERDDEVLILRQLHQTLSEDLQSIDRIWKITRQREQRITELVEYLESDKPYTPELGRNFQALFGWRVINIRTAPFEALKIQGYKSISSPLLREKLISFYEDAYHKLEFSSHLDRDLAFDKIQPYFFGNFTLEIAAINDVDGGTQDWVPKDYDKIKAEGFVANVSRFRADILRRFDLQHYATVAVAMRDILNTIEQELAAHE